MRSAWSAPRSTRSSPDPPGTRAAAGGPPRDTRLAREARGWLDHLAVERGASANTLAAYRRDLDRYLAFLHARGVTEPEQVHEALVTDFLATLREGTATHPPMAASSSARTLVAVRGLHRFLALEGVVAADPAAAVRPPKAPLRLPKAISVERGRAPAAGGVGGRHTGRAARPGPRSSCSTGPARASPRRLASTSTTSTWTPARRACSARGPRSGSCRWAGTRGRRSRHTSCAPAPRWQPRGGARPLCCSGSAAGG